MKIKLSGSILFIIAIAFLCLIPFRRTNAQECQCVCSNSSGVADNEAACRQSCEAFGAEFVSCVAENQQAPAEQQAAQPAAAQPAGQQLFNPLGTSNISEIIARVIKAVLGMVGSIALLMFVYGGFLWMTAGGNEKNVQKGKDVLVWAVIGLVVIFSSYAILSFIISKLTTVPPGA